jgi:hypothetical protein
MLFDFVGGFKRVAAGRAKSISGINDSAAFVEQK